MSSHSARKRLEPLSPFTSSTTSVVSPLDTEDAPPIDFARLLDFFENPLSADFHDRQAYCLTQLARAFPSGFKIREIHFITKVLNHVASITMQSVESVYSKFSQELCVLLPLCALPYRKERAIDEVQFRDDAVDLIRAVALFVRSPDPEVQQYSADTISKLLQQALNKDKTVRKSSEHVPDLKALNESGAVQAIVAALPFFNSVALHPAFVVLKKASRSPLLAPTLCAASCLDLLVPFVNRANLADSVVASAVEVMWNVLESEPAAVPQWNAKAAISVLHESARRMLVDGTPSVTGKEVRNEIFIICNILAAHPRHCRQFVKSDFILLLLRASASASGDVSERTSASAGEFAKSVSSASEDFELRQLMWNLIFFVTAGVIDTKLQPVLLQHVLEARLVAVLARHIPCNPPDAAVAARWTLPQQSCLRRQALSLLHQLVALDEICVTEFLAEAAWAVAEYVESQRVALGRAAMASDYRQAEQAGVEDGALPVGTSLLLHVVVRARAHQHEQHPVFLHFIPILCRLCSDKFISEAPRMDALCMLAAICRQSIPACVLFAEQDGVALIKSFLNCDSGRSLFNWNVIVAAVDAVWSCVVPHEPSAVQFCNIGGIGAMLDVLEVCPDRMQPQLLACLSDFLRLPQAAQRFHLWVGLGTQKHAVQLLLGMWRREALRCGVISEDGLLVRIDRPFAGFEGQSLCVEKLFGVFRRIGHEFDYLTPAERVCMHAIVNYSKFMEGAVWQDMWQELADENLRPVSPDAEMMQDALAATSRLAEHARADQRSLIDAVRQNEQEVLDNFFAGIKRAQQQAEIIKLAGQTSILQAHRDARLWKEQMMRRAAQRTWNGSSVKGEVAALIQGTATTESHEPPSPAVVAQQYGSQFEISLPLPSSGELVAQ